MHLVKFSKNIENFRNMRSFKNLEKNKINYRKNLKNLIQFYSIFKIIFLKILSVCTIKWHCTYWKKSILYCICIVRTYIFYSSHRIYEYIKLYTIYDLVVYCIHYSGTVPSQRRFLKHFVSLFELVALHVQCAPGRKARPRGRYADIEHQAAA